MKVASFKASVLKLFKNGIFADVFCVIVFISALVLYANKLTPAALSTVGAGIALFGIYYLIAAGFYFPYLYSKYPDCDVKSKAVRFRRKSLILFACFIIIIGIFAVLLSVIYF